MAPTLRGTTRNATAASAGNTPDQDRLAVTSHKAKKYETLAGAGIATKQNTVIYSSAELTNLSIHF
jgi:hypothetical protein